MKCQEIQELLSAYVDNVCTEIERENIEKHISGCPSCKEELELLQSLVLSLNQLDDLELPSDFHQNLMDRIVILDQEKEITLELSTPKTQSSYPSRRPLIKKFNHWRVYTSFAAVFVFVLIFAVIGTNSLIQIGNNKTSETVATYDMASSTMETTETASEMTGTGDPKASAGLADSATSQESADTLNASAKMAAPTEATETTETTETVETTVTLATTESTNAMETTDSTVMSMAPETAAAPEATSIAASEETSTDAVEPKALMSQTPTNVTEKTNPLATIFLTIGIIAFLLLVSRLIYLVLKNRT